VVVAVPTVNGENHDAGDPASAVGELRAMPRKAITTMWITPLFRWSVKDDDNDGDDGGGG
jgi:hypothetical protein